jgi:hypothetical protein
MKLNNDHHLIFKKINISVQFSFENKDVYMLLSEKALDNLIFLKEMKKLKAYVQRESESVCYMLR